MSGMLQALVVDDNWYNCDLFRIALENAGYAVDIAYNGRDGLNLIQHKPFNIVLMDLQMPGMNGIQVLNQIREAEFRKEMYVLVITANPYMATDELYGLCDMVMFKPVDIRDLSLFLHRLKSIL